MTKWEYCRVDMVPDTDDGDIVSLAVFSDPPRANFYPVEDPPNDVHEGKRSAAMIYTLCKVIGQLGSEGWEAFHVTHNSDQWHFKRPMVEIED